MKLLLHDLEDLVKECNTDNWDGYDGLPISVETYINAKRFIKNIPKKLIEPSLGCEPDGSITFDWMINKDNILSVSLGNLNELSYALLKNKKPSSGTIKLKNKFPKKLKNLIKYICE